MVTRSTTSRVTKPSTSSVTGVGVSSGSGLLTGDRYVSTTGDDDADGLTRDTAWLTFGKLSEWLNGLSGGTVSAVVLAGDYGENTLTLFTDTGSTITVDFEPGVSIDSSAAVGTKHGISIQGAPNTFMTINLRGAQFVGTDINSSNGIGTTDEINLIINGAAADGTRAKFSGYDDGISGHGTSGAASQIVVNDCEFEDCTKSAWAHVASAALTHNRCKFTGKAGALAGIGDNTSTETQIFNDCEFVPIANNQPVTLRRCTLNRCIIGTPAIYASLANQISPTCIDCYMNATFDGPASGQYTRCYGFLDFRIRGTSAPAALFDRCVFEGRTNTTKFANGSTDSDGINWLGGSPEFRDCVFYDFGTAFAFLTTAQRDHMNANWDVNYCCMFENNANFQTGLTIGTNLVTSDPELSANRTSSTDQADWAVGSSGPCVGAGSSGGNIGFTLADIS